VDIEQQLEPLSHNSGCQVLRFVAIYIVNAEAPAYTWQLRRQQRQQWEPVPLLYPINIRLLVRAGPAAASRGTVTAPLQARGDGTAAGPGRRRPAPARGDGRPDSKGPRSNRPGVTAPASAWGDGCPYAPS
jgi:hypothetical protein